LEGTSELNAGDNSDANIDEEIDDVIDEGSDEIIDSYNQNKIGPLGNSDEAMSFQNRTYDERIPQQDTKLYRVYRSGGNPFGDYWTRTQPVDEASYRSDMAITHDMNPDFGTSRVVTIQVPAGSAEWYEGETAPQTDEVPGDGTVQLPGGGNQVVPTSGGFDPSWKISDLPWDDFINGP
jgi:hypothetical protein